MYIACQRGQVFNVLDVLVAFENALVEVRDGPTQRNVVVEEFREFCSSLSGVGVTPGPEGHQNLLLFVEGHVAVHHGREANGCQCLYLAVVLLANILAQVCIAVLQSVPDGINAIGPETVS